VNTYTTNPLLSDTDSDGMPDGWEADHDLDPLVDDAAADADADGLTNLQEYGYTTDPKVADTDLDGMPDGWEVTHGFNPLLDDAGADADADGLTNLQEYIYHTDPKVEDTDGDGLNDYAEVMTHDTDPLSTDTDGDALPDGWEVDHGLYPKSAAGDNGADGDPDADGLTNLQEYGSGTDPQVADTDGDGLTDAEEIQTHATDPLIPDTDSDGLPDGWEVDHAFNPLSDGGLAYGLAARWAFDDGTGETATNQVSTNWPGVLHFMVESNWVSGRGGHALWFDGTNDYVSVDQTAGAIVTAAPFTVTAVIWQEASGTSAYPTVISDIQLLTDNRWPGYALRYQYVQNRFVGFAGNSNAAANWVSQTNWSPGRMGRWVDMALSHDGTQARFFVDGREVSSALHPFDAYLRPDLRIGRGHVNAPESYWNGAIDDLRLFHAALGTNELAAVNEWVGDADGDGLINGREYELGTDPRDADTDQDGLTDFAEVMTYGTNPLLEDTDGDGLPDEWELDNGLDPLVDDAAADPDGDGLSNLQELGYDTNPQDADPDGDGLNDYAEVVTYNTNPFAADSDGDGLDDYAEVITHGTNPWSSDSDSDALPDAWEVAEGLDPLVNTGADGATGDPDGDTLTNLKEYKLGTHPMQADSDSDGLDDDEELSRGTDPLDSDSDADGLPDGWEVQYAFTPLSGMDSNLDLRCWLQFDEGSGTSLVNSARTDYRAEIRFPENTQWSDGISGGGALWLDGTDGYAAILQPSNSVVTGSSFTVCAWVWAESNSTALYPTIFSDSRWTGGSTWPGYMLRLDKTLNALAGMVGTPLDSSREISVGWWTERWSEKWTHVALIQEEGQTRLYVDGSLWAEDTNTFGMATNSEVWIGHGHVNDPDSGWRGRIDDVRIYGTALAPDQLRELFDAQGDANSDGTNNLTAWQEGLNPRAGTGTVSAEGAIELQFVPDTDWTTNEAPQYLARSGDSNPGGEFHLFVENDTLEFLLIDADGLPHIIQRRHLVGDGYLMPGITNRITASWRGFNTGAASAEMSLMINGLDYQRSTEFLNNPRLTSYDWEQGGSYRDAAFVQADWNTIVHSNTTRFGSWADGVFPLKATLVASNVYPVAYGMVSTNPTLPFTLVTKTAPDPGDRPKTLVQSLPRPKVLADFVSSNEMRVLIKRYHQVADIAESDMNWMGWDDPETVWDIMEDSVRTAIEIGEEEGLEIAISTWIHLDTKICRKYPTQIPQRARQLVVVTNGTEARVMLTNSAWFSTGGTYLEDKFDVADRLTVSNYLSAWKQDLSQFSDYSYFFFNEDALQPIRDISYLNAPTYSTNGLAWFREYIVNKYGTAYAQIRFPVSPLALGVVDSTNASSYQVVLDNSVTNRLVFTTDPDHWAKWWEWRQVVFANLMAGYTRQLADLNSTNTHWQGAIHFVSAGTAWSLESGINLQLLSRIPDLDWMVVENNRAGTYGTSDALQEKEVQLQLEAMKAVTSTNTGFGSYVMAHTYPYPEITNGVTNATYNLSWITQDMAYAASPEFQSSLLVGYSSALLVNRPGFTSTWQNAHYIPEVAEAWNTARFGHLWTPLEGHSVNEGSLTYPPYEFFWDSLEQARAYDWEFSTSETFAQTNLSAQTTNTYLTWSMLTDPMPCSRPLFWRVRGVFHVLAFDDDGNVTGTNVYRGAWAPAPDSITLVDSDGDKMPDAWEFNYFNDLDETDDGDPDGDSVTNLDEYFAATDPAP